LIDTKYIRHHTHKATPTHNKLSETLIANYFTFLYGTEAAAEHAKQLTSPKQLLNATLDVASSVLM